MYITALWSRFGETLDFVQQITIHGQNVEQWMKKLEAQMFVTVRAYMERSVEDYLKNHTYFY